MTTDFFDTRIWMQKRCSGENRAEVYIQYIERGSQPISRFWAKSKSQRRASLGLEVCDA